MAAPKRQFIVTVEGSWLDGDRKVTAAQVAADLRQAVKGQFLYLARRTSVKRIPAEAAPLPMILHCPACHLQHVDEPDERTEGWANPPHRSHLCHGCGHIWRPADVPTEGVKAIQTRGKNDSPAPEAPASEQTIELLSKLTDAADAFLKGGVAPVGPLIDKARAHLACTPATEGSGWTAALKAARSRCWGISAEYFSRASEGKLNSIRRNRNNWKMSAADECANAITDLLRATPAATTASPPICPWCEKDALVPSHKDGNVQNYQCGECLNFSHAATTASTNKGEKA